MTRATATPAVPPAQPISRGAWTSGTIRRCLAILIAMLLASIAGCAVTSTPPGGGAMPGITGFLHTDSNTVIYLQWSSTSAEALTGTMKYDVVSGTPPQQTIKDESFEFAGQVHSGQGISLNFLTSWGTVYGTLSGNTLTLNIPPQGGGLTAIPFHTATPDDYNISITDLRNTIGVNNRNAQHQQQIAAEEGQLAHDFELVPGAPQGLASKLNDLYTAVTRTGNDLATVRKDVTKVKSEANSYSVCYDASTTGYDARTAGYDAGAVQISVNGVANSISSLRSAISTLDADLKRVQADEPGYGGTSGSPSPAAVQQAINSATTAIAQTVSKANAAIDQSNKNVSDAYTVATTVRYIQGTDCTGTLTPPPPIQDLS